MREHYDFNNAQRGAVIQSNKERITIRLDSDVVQWFRDQVAGGGNYQSLINAALQQHIQSVEGKEPLEAVLRRVIREEIRKVG
ncbi:MAG: BrnA antitoxin family protein [Gammaproteobacteria bacterium]|nr:BrnA antitoxin family protein [Gammaproteobacteria bacterium]MDQ7075037.1 BrnA antitoxin family protein [Gammaproteobacteria bacterium]